MSKCYYIELVGNWSPMWLGQQPDGEWSWMARIEDAAPFSSVERARYAARKVLSNTTGCNNFLIREIQD